VPALPNKPEKYSNTAEPFGTISGAEDLRVPSFNVKTALKRKLKRCY
jgi:hypothetical protein